MKVKVFLGALGVALLASGVRAQTTGMTAEERIKKIERQMLDLQSKMREQMEALQREMKTLKEEQEKEAAEAREEQEERIEQVQTAQEELGKRTLSLLERVKLGGYGSMRYDNSSLDDLNGTFTFRRAVFTTDANIAPRLRFYSELEYERFRKLELERRFTPSEGGLAVEQAIEGTDGSEIAMEQAWLQYDLNNWLSLRAGGVLVPLGRFNIRHDDNLWNLPRRSLVDRGTPVLPVAAAWDELGVGFVGRTLLGSQGALEYQLYVVNGASLDAEVEDIIQTRDPKRSKLEAEVEFSPSTGTFFADTKDAKSVTGRLALSPAVGHELGASFYVGRYTPAFLDDETLWSLGFDGLTHLGGVDLEWQYIFTRFEGIRNVARSFAGVVKEQAEEVESEFSPDLETEIEFELANLARTKHGYWLEARYPFWLDALNDTFLGRGFTDPQLVPVLRWEQVWLPSLLQEAAFEGGELTEFATESRFVHRITAGLAYRPMPLVGFTLAYEYTWTNEGKSLGGVTNFLPAGEDEDDARAFLAGMTFGF